VAPKIRGEDAELWRESGDDLVPYGMVAAEAVEEDDGGSRALVVPEHLDRRRRRLGHAASSEPRYLPLFRPKRAVGSNSPPGVGPAWRAGS
jgi:hypothetical protein